MNLCTLSGSRVIMLLLDDFGENVPETYSVMLTNFGVVICSHCTTIAAALEEAVEAGFESTIISSVDGQLVGSWSPIGGYRPLR